MTSASTRFPASSRAAAPGVVCSSLVVEREAHRAQLLGEPGARARRVVGDEAECVTRAAKLRDGLRGAGDRLPGDVQHAVDVEQNARHGA